MNTSWIDELKKVNFNKASQESICKDCYSLIEEVGRIALLKSKYPDSEEKQVYYNNRIKDIRSLFNEMTLNLAGWLSDYELSDMIYNFNQTIKRCRNNASLNELKEEIEEVKQYPDVKSYVSLDKTKLEYKPMAYYEMIKGTQIGRLYKGIQDAIIQTLQEAEITKYSITELLQGQQKLINGVTEKTLQFGIDYYINFKHELKQTKNVLEFQNILEKYRDIFNRYGTPQVGMMNFNSSFEKSVKSNTDQFTMPLGSATRDIINNYITDFNRQHGINSYKFREPIQQSKIYKYGFTSYEEFYEFAKAI